MEISELVRNLLAKRGVVEEPDISAFLNPDYDLHTHDPMLLSDMQAALDRLFDALQRGERIAVYADFDCDGIPGAAVLSDFFEKIGYSNFEVYLPHRDREGYGLHQEAIRELASRQVGLIITVDVGTAAVEAVAFARSLGVDVIITDHHEVMGGLPDACAVVNPKLNGYPFAHLCGAGVAFKFVQAALAQGKQRGLQEFLAIPDGWEKWLLDLVAIATVADMVPLVGENRVLVRFGLRVLRKSPRLGIEALCERARTRKADLTEDDIGFLIAPRINAASRMDEPALALRLLTTHDASQAQQLAGHLEELNASRKGIVGSVVREARKHVHARFRKDERIVVLGNPVWKPALLGLAANSIMEERGGVVCLWGRDGNGKLKGSCRSDGSYSLVELFGAARDAFDEFGGHDRSGGFSVSSERVHALPEALASAAAKLQAREELPAADSDALITLSELSQALYGEVSALSPFGMGNAKPVFHISGVVLTEVRRFGKERNHTEVMLECRRSGARARAFDFFRSPEDFSHPAAQGEEAAVLATIERDTYRGGLCLRLVDIVAG